jgi:ribosome-binding factor A
MTPKSSARAVRIAAQMQRSISGLLRRGVKDPRVGNVTVTAVELAPDLSVARVHFLPFASTHPPAEVIAGLRSAAGYLRGEVARELQLRHAPRLEFELDTQIEHAARLTELIDHAVDADRAREQAATPPEVAADPAADPKE